MKLTKKQADLLNDLTGMSDVTIADLGFFEGEEVDAWELIIYADKVVLEEIVEQGRWDTTHRKVLQFNERFLEVVYVSSSTEPQESEDYLEMKEVFKKVVEKIDYI